MCIPEKVDKVPVSDGQGRTKMLGAGDQVRLKPDYSADDSFGRRSMIDFLGGDGPFEIEWVGVWPCGRSMLYLKPRGAGAHARDFVAVTT